jgi:hypothetical protein
MSEKEKVMKFQVIQSTRASVDDDVLATCHTYEDALAKVVEIAKSRDGFLRSWSVPDAWCIVAPSGHDHCTLVIQGVAS